MIFFCKWCTKVQGWNIIFFIFGLASANMQQIKKYTDGSDVYSISTTFGEAGSKFSKNSCSLVFTDNLPSPVMAFAITFVMVYYIYVWRGYGTCIFYVLDSDSGNIQQIKKIMVVLKSVKLVLHLVKRAPNFPKIVAV